MISFDTIIANSAGAVITQPNSRRSIYRLKRVQIIDSVILPGPHHTLEDDIDHQNSAERDGLHERFLGVEQSYTGDGYRTRQKRNTPPICFWVKAEDHKLDGSRIASAGHGQGGRVPHGMEEEYDVSAVCVCVFEEFWTRFRMIGFA